MVEKSNLQMYNLYKNVANGESKYRTTLVKV